MGRFRRWMPNVAIFAFLGIAIAVVGMAHAEAGAAFDARGDLAQPYREGPLEGRRSDPALAWPQGVEELLALGVITAILCGFRASGLARQRHVERLGTPGSSAHVSADTSPHVSPSVSPPTSVPHDEAPSASGPRSALLRHF
jgi:hypothetical protein